MTVISPDSNTVVIVSSLVVYKTKFEPTKNTKGERTASGVTDTSTDFSESRNDFLRIRLFSRLVRLPFRRFGRPIGPAEVAGEPTRIRPGGFSPSVVLVGSNAVISIGGELPVVTVLLAGLITGGGFVRQGRISIKFAIIGFSSHFFVSFLELSCHFWTYRHSRQQR
ncbi:hypothetical protein IW262DRAFT_668917 [Armillaria fumosa]|nr:hypothetical protein IW262DRAFT_668917 [Armillaria fumosa]